MKLMEQLRLALGFFRCTGLQHWPGLAFYFTGWLLWRVSGLRLFNERRLRIGGLTVVAEVEGRSGLVFLHEILIRHVYDFPALHQAAPPRVIFDVGANCGFFTLDAALRWPESRIICFEPHPASFQRLQKNLSANHLEERVSAIPAAAGSVPGECQLQISGDSSMGVVAASNTGGAGLIKVDLVTLDDCARTRGQYPDLIKIDVEGFEVEVLQGARTCLERANHVILEAHSDDLMRRCLELLHQAEFKTKQAGALIFAAK